MNEKDKEELMQYILLRAKLAESKHLNSYLSFIREVRRQFRLDLKEARPIVDLYLATGEIIFPEQKDKQEDKQGKKE